MAFPGEARREDTCDGAVLAGMWVGGSDTEPSRRGSFQVASHVAPTVASGRGRDLACEPRESRMEDSKGVLPAVHKASEGAEVAAYCRRNGIAQPTLVVSTRV